MNKITLISKKTFLTFFIGLFISLTSQAQIVYVDLNSIEGTSESSHTFDLNNDGVDDFTIASGDFGWGDSMGVAPLNGNAVLSTFNARPFALEVESIIEADDANWNTATAQAMYLDLFNLGFLITGNWVNVTDKYLGLKYYVGGNTHYAWMRLDVTNEGNWVIKDYAYNNTPNAQIAAGQTMVLSADKEFSTDVKVFSYNQEISILNLTEESKYELYSITGQQVRKGIAQRNKHIIRTESLTTGVYILKVEGLDSGKLLTKKLIL